MRAATSPNIIKRAPAQVRAETRGARIKCAPIVSSPVATTAATTASSFVKMSAPSASRPDLPSLLPAPLKTESIPRVGLKVPERDASKSACPSISPHKKVVVVHVDAATDRVLTFLQNARAQNIPVRAGKWNPEEDAYLRKLVELFCLGVLDEVAPKSSMRAWLSRMLNCCPMRISKKQMNGEKFVGKAKFKRSDDAISRMTQTQYDAACDEIYQLRANFIIHWAKDEFAKRTTKDAAMTFDEWYAKALEIIPRPKIAAHDRIIETKRRPEPESIDALHAQLQQERVKQRQRVAAATAVASNRCFKRQRVNAAVDVRSKAETQFQDLMASFTLPHEPVAMNSVESSLSASYIDSLDAAESWVLEICAEPEFEVLDPCVETGEFSQHLGFAKAAQATTEPENEFQCNEVLSPQDAGTLRFDFGLPSKLESHEVFDLSSCGPEVWDDNDLLLDGFALLSDQSLVLWDDSDLAFDTNGHPAHSPRITALQL